MFSSHAHNHERSAENTVFDEAQSTNMPAISAPKFQLDASVANQIQGASPENTHRKSPKNFNPGNDREEATSSQHTPFQLAENSRQQPDQRTPFQLKALKNEGNELGSSPQKAHSPQVCGKKKPFQVELSRKQLKGHTPKPPKGCSFLYSKFKVEINATKTRDHIWRKADNQKAKTGKYFMYHMPRIEPITDLTPNKLLTNYVYKHYQKMAKKQNLAGLPSRGKGQNVDTVRVPAGKLMVAMIERWKVEGAVHYVRQIKCRKPDGSVVYKRGPRFMVPIKYYTAAAINRKFIYPAGPNTKYNNVHPHPSKLRSLQKTKQQDAMPYGIG